MTSILFVPTTFRYFFFYFLTAASRISVNFSYKSVVEQWHSRMFAIPEFLPLNDAYVYLIVSVVKVLCIQYIRHLDYEGFIMMYDNISVDEVHDSFRVINKHA